MVTNDPPQQHTPRKRLLGWAMIAAPVLLLASSVAYAAGGGLGSDQVGGAIQLYAGAAFVLAVIGLARTIERSFPRAAGALTVLGILGAVAAAGFGIDSIRVGLDGSTPLADAGGAAGALALNLPGIVFPVALLGFGAALARAGVEPFWCGLALAAGAVLFPISRIGDIELLAVAVDCVLLVALAPLGWTMVHGRDPVATPRRGSASPSATATSPPQAADPPAPPAPDAQPVGSRRRKWGSEGYQ